MFELCPTDQNTIKEVNQLNQVNKVKEVNEVNEVNQVEKVNQVKKVSKVSKVGKVSKVSKEKEVSNEKKKVKRKTKKNATPSTDTDTDADTHTEKNECDFYILDDVVYFMLKGRAQKDGTYAMVSMDKWPYVSKYQWYLGKSGYPMSYDLGKMQLHRFVYTYILKAYPPSNLYVDHIDRNKLNNTDNNLRLATPQENSFNKSTLTNKKGVKKISDNNYTASITKNGVRNEIKNIASEKEAAEIYNMMAEELFGEFAALNQV